MNMITHVYHLPSKIFVGFFRMADISLSASGYGVIWNWLEKK